MKRILLPAILGIIGILLGFGCKNDIPKNQDKNNITKDQDKKDCDFFVKRMQRKNVDLTQTEMDISILFDLLNEPKSQLYEITHKANKGNYNIYFTCTKNDSIIYENKIVDRKFKKNPGIRYLNVSGKTITSDDSKKRHFKVQLTEFSSFGTSYTNDSFEITAIRRIGFSEDFDLSYCLKNKDRPIIFNRGFSVGKPKDGKMESWDFNISLEIIEEL